MVMVFLTVFACIPLVYRTLKYEERKDMMNLKEKVLIKEHEKAIKFLMYLFFGFIIAYALWFVFMPQNSAEGLFDVQLKTIESINSSVTGKSYGFGTFIQILANNMKVLLFCILFAFFYGAGAIFILKNHGWSDTQKLELTGADGGPIDMRIAEMSDEELEKLLAD